MTDYNEHNLPADFDDLSKHAPLLDKLRTKGDGFVLPENHFGESEEHIISLTKLTNADYRDQTTDNCFSVPENYFDELADRIIAIVNLATADKLKPNNLFKVPESYFNELDETINTKLALDNLKQDEGFAVPENYFEKFADKILSQIAVNELNKKSHDSSLTSQVSHLTSQVSPPAGYFDTLADRVAARIADEEKIEPEQAAGRGRIIVFAEVVKRYAKPISVAASVTLILAVSIWFFNRGEQEKNEIVKVITPVKNIPPVIPAPKKDSVIVSVQPENIAVQPIINKVKPPINLPEQAVVKEPNSKDVLEQLDLLDESMVADYLIETNAQVETAPAEESLNEEMLQYLLDHNTDPSDIK